MIPSYFSEAFARNQKESSHLVEGIFGNQAEPWRTVTRESQNTFLRRAKRELGDLKSLKASIEEYIYSEETSDYDPIAEYLDQLPAWDGHDRVRELFQRLPGVSEE